MPDATANAKLSPMLRQYLEIKEQYKDCILFFRLGDFYEMFYDDAITAARELEITLTKKTVGGGLDRAPLCGVPYHSAESYLAKLIEKGYKVAICEQTEDPKLAKGLVKRDVIRVVTPGTVTGEQMLSARDNNYLACVYEAADSYGLAWCDISTGELSLAQISGEGREETLAGRIALIGASEVLMVSSSPEPPKDIRAAARNAEDTAPEGEVSGSANPGATSPQDGRKGHMSELEKSLRSASGAQITELSLKEAREGRTPFEKTFGASAATAYGIDREGAAAYAVYGLFAYLERTQKQQISYMRPPALQNLTEHMLLDRSSIRSLELTETLTDRQTKGSLLGVLDKTRTAMGGRLMKKWLKEPLKDVAEIRRRLDAVEHLYDDVLMLNNIGEHLKSVYDIERLVGRVSYGNANARDLTALLRSAEAIPDIKAELADACAGTDTDTKTDALAATDAGADTKTDKNSLLRQLAAQMSDLAEVRALISGAITDDPPFTLREGGIIRENYSEELDALKLSIKDGQQWLAGLETKERERTGIKILKEGANKVFGYYIDITNSNKSLVPEYYIRKQTLVNSERYITPEMKEIESVVLGAEVRINEMEYRLFGELRLKLRAHTEELQRTSLAIGALDTLASFAEVSSKNGYVKPDIRDDDIIEIERGRHPVIELTLTGTVFVPNDTHIDRAAYSMLLITGPNMAGKSTYMRQTALIVLMAQAGCFVPAERARIGAVDRLYTRIGAADNIARGESTFFVEMNELAYILNTATEKSLVILDEIGRGTSTYDGLAIAWAVSDYLTARRVRTMFATHYHELTALENTLEGLKNMNTEIADTGDDIVFLHRIGDGPASRSYGIHVARLAGVPQTLLDEAQLKLDELESKSDAADVYNGGVKNFPVPAAASSARGDEAEAPRAENGGMTPPAAHAAKGDKGESGQLSMFSFAPNPVLEKLKSLDLLSITPSQAFAILEDLKKAAHESEV
jgi:DNA mismatch repair protein MutS